MKSRFICVVSSPNLWEDHHHLILSLRPVMGIQRAGYQTVQSAGKIQNVPLAHLELAVAAEGKRWLLAGGQITGRDASGLLHLHPGFSSFRSSSLFICLFIIFCHYVCCVACQQYSPPPPFYFPLRQRIITLCSIPDPLLSVGSYLELEIGPKTLHQCPSPSYLPLPTFIKTSAFISCWVIQA